VFVLTFVFPLLYIEDRFLGANNKIEKRKLCQILKRLREYHFDKNIRYNKIKTQFPILQKRDY
jgi:hypothetical protein